MTFVASSKDKTLSIDPLTLEPFLNSALANVVVIYQTTACESCKKLLDVVLEVNERYEGNQNIFLMTVDCHTHDVFCRRMYVLNYPTIRFYGKKIPTHDPYEDATLIPYTEFNGKKTKESLIQWIDDEVNKVDEIINAEMAANVVSLDNDNFYKYVWTDKHVFVCFYANWNEESRKFNKVWNNISRFYLKQDNIVIGKVNGLKNIELKQKFKITEYPSIIYFPPKNGEYTIYNGDKEITKIISFFNSQVTSSTIKNHIENNKNNENDIIENKENVDKNIENKNDDNNLNTKLKNDLEKEKIRERKLNEFRKIIKEKGKGIQKELVRIIEESHKDESSPVSEEIQLIKQNNYNTFKKCHLPLLN